MKYVIWNPEHIRNTVNHNVLIEAEKEYGRSNSLDEYEFLQLVEEKSDGSWSSIVETNDIDGLIRAFMNETNADMCYEKYDVIEMVHLGDYEDWDAAKDVGGTYEIKYGVIPESDIKPIVTVAKDTLRAVGKDVKDYAFYLNGVLL